MNEGRLDGWKRKTSKQKKEENTEGYLNIKSFFAIGDISGFYQSLLFSINLFPGNFGHLSGELQNKNVKLKIYSKYGDSSINAMAKISP